GPAGRSPTVPFTSRSGGLMSRFTWTTAAVAGVVILWSAGDAAAQGRGGRGGGGRGGGARTTQAVSGSAATTGTGTAQKAATQTAASGTSAQGAAGTAGRCGR